MSLTHLIDQFRGVSHSPSELIVQRDGWLWATRCECWMDDAPQHRMTILAVYKSALVTAHKRMYQPIADLLLAADHVDVLARGVREADDRMMAGDKGAQWFVARLMPATYEFSPTHPSLEEVRSIMQANAERLVG